RSWSMRSRDGRRAATSPTATARLPRCPPRGGSRRIAPHLLMRLGLHRTSNNTRLCAESLYEPHCSVGILSRASTASCDQSRVLDCGITIARWRDVTAPQARRRDVVRVTGGSRRRFADRHVPGGVLVIGPQKSAIP